jgi:hypothetical protein
MNRVTTIAHNVIRPTQTSFTPRRHILEGVVILHEIIHELHRNKLVGVLLKIVLEIAYEQVRWPFIRALILNGTTR